ncbi:MULTISPECIES: hypothetical protein [unclassified Methylophilus]|uniref:hypothetical protein n=1 Tax=unclassified Methylophilus TaxID=2630143 RepID=UPI00035F1CBD|nr:MULTISPECIES: hypothetical protein [unclassified Methylophilus]
MKKISILLLIISFSNPVLSGNFKTGSYYVKETVLEERLAPNSKGKVTNKIYRQQKVDVLEVKGGWGRVSRYYDGEVAGEKGQVARWVLISGLSPKLPSDLAQPTIKSDPRILKDAIPKVGENGLNENDIKILNKGATKILNSGQCAIIQYADKSASKPNTYFVNCGGPNIFFTPSDL